MEVVFGGGRKKLMPQNQKDPEYPDKKGERLDGRSLIQEWLDKYPNSEYVWNKTQFDQIDAEKVDHVIGTTRNVLSWFGSFGRFHVLQTGIKVK